MAVTSEDEARAIVGTATPYVHVAADGILIAAGYSAALERLLRWVPNATWRPDRRALLVPLAGAAAVRSVLPEIQRLAEAAQEDVATAGRNKDDPSLGQAWLPALAQATGHAHDDITALTQSPENLDRDAVEKLIHVLHGETAKLLALADRLENWLKGGE